MNVYTGFRVRGLAVVMKNGEVLAPNKSQVVWNHSPDGFEWGYVGSGPAQLSLAIMLEELPLAFAVRLYHRFNREVVSQFFKEGFALTAHQVGAFLSYNVGDLLECVRELEQRALKSNDLEGILRVSYNAKEPGGD